ncbi:MAG: ABC transporter ATP-binding protein [Oceanospirillaceae bacterium]|nr:ABC transporter ATP-binding protein [Oceanospirillaceae bacterium]
MIEIRNLYKRYHNHHGSDWILKDINLTIPKGVSVGLIGANGAGKSTLLRLIAGMDSPDKGEVIRHCRVSWPIGLAGGFQGSMTGRQNVKFVARALGGSEREMQRIIRFVEDFAEIGDAFDEPIRTYSSGMRSRLGFGLSFAFNFDVYISDEATAVGDRAFKDKAKQLFRDKVGQASLIMVSHGEGILRDLCQAGIYLKEGKAHWYDDIGDAIVAYHADSDKGKARQISSKWSGLVVQDSTALSKGQLQELRKELQQARVKINGFRLCVATARGEQWPKEEIDILLKLQAQAKSRMDQLLNAINNTPSGVRTAAKQAVNQAQGSLSAIESAIRGAEASELNEYEMSVLQKFEKAAGKWKAKAEAELDKIDGFD